MRVVFVALETAFHRTSPETLRVRGLAERLAGRGHDVVVLCAKWWTSQDGSWVENDVTYRAVVGDVDAKRSFRWALPTRVPRERPDVVHAAGTPASQVPAAKKGARLARAPLVTEWYGDVERYGRTERKALARSDRVLVPSELVETAVREHVDLGSDAVEVVPNSVDVDAIRGTEPRQVADVVYARTLDEDANLESLLLALAELRQTDWTAAVIGDGPERESYERQARDLRIDDRITWLGECSRDQRVAVYRGAHVFAQTADECLFAEELLWALASGCVGIVEYHAGSSAHELVEHYLEPGGNRDRGFRTTSEQELAAAIRDAASLERLDYDPAFDAYDHDAVLETYLQCYRDEIAATGLF
ncbi:glycosyltransferase family 4 protein [Halorubellus sp. JP-L1]|uniref:glycosyltransferase n=1 Tax=Halorubellus sp. JP-L1 TaxID=2715753 RepID=UPI00140D56F6|nr:glycosyltransferase [Halorubellus sp. JP-L1]NHN42287.1 glycosyltransferase family 4 protein [Halorubellus sp. JP-L1]